MKRYIISILLLLALSAIPASAIQKVEKLSDEEIAARLEEMRKNFVEDDGSWIFSKVFTVDGNTATDIYGVALETFAEMYGDSKAVIQTSDKEAGIVIGKGAVLSDAYEWTAWIAAIYRAWQIVKIEAREGRYKVTITVNEIEVETGGAVSPECLHGEKEPLFSFYPYNNSVVAKLHKGHYNALSYSYECALRMIDRFGEKINKKLAAKEDDNW